MTALPASGAASMVSIFLMNSKNLPFFCVCYCSDCFVRYSSVYFRFAEGCEENPRLPRLVKNPRCGLTGWKVGMERGRGWGECCWKRLRMSLSWTVCW